MRGLASSPQLKRYTTYRYQQENGASYLSIDGQSAGLQNHATVPFFLGATCLHGSPSPGMISSRKKEKRVESHKSSPILCRDTPTAIGTNHHHCDCKPREQEGLPRLVQSSSTGCSFFNPRPLLMDSTEKKLRLAGL